MTNLKKISDNELFIRCKKYGKEVLKARQIFGGLLPEVCKRRLYEKKGFDSIYLFAAKLAGFTHNQVDTYIRLERKFEDKPALHAALVEGQISANKLIRIASIATVENQGELFEAAKKLSKTAIDVYVKDYKLEHAGGTCRAVLAGDEIEKRDGLFPFENALKTLPGQTSWSEMAAGPNSAGAKTPNLDFEIIAALTPELKNKIKALIDKGINISELFTALLEQHNEKIEQEKNEIAVELERKKPVTRYIPVMVKNIIKQEYGTKCGHPNCKKFTDNLHHQKRFAIFKTHDPRFIKPLCKGHHELEHVDDQNYRQFISAASG